MLLFFLPVLVLTTPCLTQAPTSKSGFINSGTPASATLSFDCSVREYAYEYGQYLQPSHGSFVELFDALQLNACNLTRPKKNDRHIPKYPKSSTDGLCVFYVDPMYGNDSNSGLSPDNAFLTIQKSIDETRNTRVNNEMCTINLLEGIFYQKETLYLTPNDSYLTIQNYNGENVILSGGVQLQFEDTKWTLEEYKPIQWNIYNNSNNIWNRVSFNTSNDLVKYIGNFNTFDECKTSVSNSYMNPFYSFTWFNLAQNEYSGQCYAVKDISWQPIDSNGIISGRLEGRNIWSRKVKNWYDLSNNDISGLRINNNRAIRARYPDQNPEISMEYDPFSGWIEYDTKWKAAINTTIPKDILQSSEDWPNVIWPMVRPGNTTSYTGDGDMGYFWIGKGGYCTEQFGISPDFGYWCSANAPRGSSYEHKSPSGIYLPSNVGLNAPYTNPAQALIHGWNGKNKWYTRMWNISSYDPSIGLMEFDVGGNQGGIGDPSMSAWYIENIFEELTMPNEYFYNKTTHTLYYYYNSTFQQPPPDDTLFVATRNKIIFNISGNYRLQNGPIVRNITIRGLTIRDTKLTYLDNHAIPSGGDWSITKKGSIYIQGSEQCNFDSLYFTRLDNNGIFIYGYNRNLSVTNSYFEWMGENGILSLGYTEGLEDILPGGGPDGRMGNQPRYNYIYNNLAREIGIFEKQASMYFQALATQTIFKNNVYFNGPRAGYNTNDGFGGNNKIHNNLLINSCRESYDVGVINSWDRVPYITTIGNGSASIIPGYNYIYNNFILNTYHTQLSVDMDDGSSYYKVFNNFLVYGNSSMKNEYGGHDSLYYGNIHAYPYGPIFGTFCCDSGANDEFIGSTVIVPNNEYYTSDCNLPKGAVGMVVSNNTVYMPNPLNYTICNMSFNQWQEEGNDPGTTLHSLPSDEEVIQWAKQLLQGSEKY